MVRGGDVSNHSVMFTSPPKLFTTCSTAALVPFIRFVRIIDLKTERFNNTGQLSLHVSAFHCQAK